MSSLHPKKDPRIALVAGSFDPVTNGHMALVKEASLRFERVYLTVFINDKKRYLFSMEERRAFLELAASDYPNVQVDACRGMLADYAREKGITAVVKGYRNEEDLRYEQMQAEVNRERFPHLETVLLPSEEALENLSSTVVRNRLLAGKSIASLVPEKAEKAIWETFRNIQKCK